MSGAKIATHWRAVDCNPTARIAPPAGALHSVRKPLSMSGSLLSPRNLEYVFEYVGSGNSFMAIARLVNDELAHTANQVFPWVRNAPFFLGFAGINPKALIKGDALAGRLICSGLA